MLVIICFLNLPHGRAFDFASKDYTLSFPRDHGAHPTFKTEWWYFTGNLKTKTGRHFGYQLTFFRNALSDQSVTTKKSWRTNQIYLAHFAVSDVLKSKHISSEKNSRGVAGLAEARYNPMKVYIDDWSFSGDPATGCHLKARAEGYEIDLNLRSVKPIVQHGIGGYSQKGRDPKNASMYYSFTRLATAGNIRIAAQIFEVNGLSWMDHEFSTSVLEKGQTGWDWFSLQMEDDTELMFFKLRGTSLANTKLSGTYVSSKGVSTILDEKDFTIEETSTWQSPRTKARYPSKWAINLPKYNLSLNITPLLSDQEMKTSVSYFEGAVEVQGQRGKKNIHGYGYVEMTGYVHSMENVF